MGCTLADHVGGSAGAGHRAAHRGPFIDHDGLDHQRINGQFRIILGVGQRGLERLIQQVGTLLGGVGQDVGGLGDGLDLDFLSNIAHLLGGDAGVFVNSFHFHGFFLVVQVIMKMI